MILNIIAKNYKIKSEGLSQNIDGFSLIGGANINKSSSSDENIDKSLADYGVGLHLGVIKPFANKYSASFIGSYQFDIGKEDSTDVYAIKSSLSWIYIRRVKLQIQSNYKLNLLCFYLILKYF